MTPFWYATQLSNGIANENCTLPLSQWRGVGCIKNAFSSETDLAYSSFYCLILPYQSKVFGDKWSNLVFIWPPKYFWPLKYFQYTYKENALFGGRYFNTFFQLTYLIEGCTIKKQLNSLNIIWNLLQNLPHLGLPRTHHLDTAQWHSQGVQIKVLLLQRVFSTLKMADAGWF